MLLCIDAAYTVDHWEERALPGFMASAVDAVRSVKKCTASPTGPGRPSYRPRPEAWPGFRPAPELYD